MQTDDLEKKKYKNLRDVFFQRLKEGGAKTFYKGLGVTLIRAIFVNAGAFFSFEASMRALGRSEHSEWFILLFMFSLFNSKLLAYVDQKYSFIQKI